MKQKFYPVICAIVIALTFFSTTVSAQSSMLSGSYPAASENLLGVRYRKLNLATSNQSGAVYSGIPDLNSNRSNSRADGDLVYGTGGTYIFAITYNTVTNTFTTATTIAGSTVSNVVTNVSGKLSSDGKVASAGNINLMNLIVKSHNANTITVSNLTIDGVPVTGTYGRSNSLGTSNWYIPSAALNNGFVVTGIVTMAGTMANGNEAQFVELGFANSAAAAPGPLPVVWGGFAGKRVNNASIGLQWRTLQEQNTSHYNIQRSEDGVHFRTIAMAMAQGTTASVTDYNFEDKQATGNMYYYRLEQVDLNGSSSFSSIIKLGNGGKKTLVGGLGSNKILVQFFSNDNRSVRIVNNSGVIVKQMNSTTQQETLDVNSLPIGVYALQIINSDGTSEVHRFVK
ncbi:T9SS type A sorting domain-containing protein [Lacibacter luteus]|uniref:T9SS type A sorting domain-containing protein n=1 Tax=Lacibacter luteus TaxID=2508719 RepID=A0A4Q1CJV1_9BACT|nr:T9SS type A sorting domain-containing protein [Lacibacter luteus]RXK60909.1 T9SS type A sorting domain-containing protein [Lacibacter luteus]